MGGSTEHGKRRSRWTRWFFGAVILGAVIAIAIRSSEEKEFLRLVDQAEPAWLGLAVVLQLCTYLPEGEVWRLVVRKGSAVVPRATTYKLSVAKLFIDQAIPSAGISGTLVFARALEQRGVSRPVVASALLVDTLAYHASYVLSLVVALSILAVAGEASPVLLTAALVFALFAALVVAVALALSRTDLRLPHRLERIPLVGEITRLLRASNPELVRDPDLLLVAGFYHLVIVSLDVTTMWCLIRSLGAHALPAGVYASFMISSLFRTLGVVPGGLGTFEASSILTLKMIGVSVPVGLSATLLFRGLSFWLPLVPGLLFSRQAVGKQLDASRDDASAD